jgi:Ni,Fe-hydrogenase III small subunit
MSQWLWRGMRTGVVTTPYPASQDVAEGLSPGLPVGGAYPAAAAGTLSACCPTGALSVTHGEVVVDYRRCVHCFRCARDVAPPLAWSRDYEWAAAVGVNAKANHFGHSFDRSVHIIVVDAGDCGACLHEVRQLNNPYYNMHRLGFFLTPTPRHADVLLVVGPVTDQMQIALQKTYDAMPTPKRVVAVGACALSGGVFGPSFVSGGGVGQVLPVDVEVPGQPPPPLAILHGLLLAVGRAAPASLSSPTAARAPIATP